jgi:Tfp pilus assembly protein PilE
VVVVIITIIALLAVPVYMGKAESARISTAQTECRELAEAEEACYNQHGYYVPLQVLNDLPLYLGEPFPANYIDQEYSIYVIDPYQLANGYINIPAVNYQMNPTTANTNQRVRNLIINWQGPFLNPQRVYKNLVNVASTGAVNAPDSTVLLDYPLDPWGNPYRFYSPYGIIGTNAISTNPTDYNTPIFSDGLPTYTDAGHKFDRFAIVSFGPNGVSDTYTNPSLINHDDIYYTFSVVPSTTNETVYQP